MFVGVESSKKVQIFSSNYESGFSHLRQVMLPRDASLANSFTVLDTTEQQVFLFIENRNLGTPFGNVYISDEKGRYFTLSVANVVKKNGKIDFQKVSSLPGTFVVNRYSKELEALTEPGY
jgi:hypothetical protein